VAGIAEVIKYGAIWDTQFLRYLKDHMPRLLSLDSSVLHHVVSTSAAIKVNVVQQDEKESDLRKILNFGHTVGHAIERNKKVLHGEAVAAGMVWAARISKAYGLLSEEEVTLLKDVIELAGLPVEMDLDPEEIYLNIRKDKKKRGEDIHFVMLEGLGKAVVKTLSLDELKELLHDLH
jgi:3-dehydroquinate synthase